MATIIARGRDDLLLDAYVAKLEAFRVREVAISSAVNFDITRDNRAPWSTAVPLVNITADDAYEPKGSSPLRTRMGRLSVKAECWVPFSASRFAYLKQQVLAGLFDLSDRDVGQPAGSINAPGWPSWINAEPNTLPQEVDIYAGAWTWDVLYAWSPTETVYPDLSEVSITTLQAWGVDFHFV